MPSPCSRSTIGLLTSPEALSSPLLIASHCTPLRRHRAAIAGTNPPSHRRTFTTQSPRPLNDARFIGILLRAATLRVDQANRVERDERERTPRPVRKRRRVHHERLSESTPTPRVHPPPPPHGHRTVPQARAPGLSLAAARQSGL